MTQDQKKDSLACIKLNKKLLGSSESRKYEMLKQSLYQHASKLMNVKWGKNSTIQIPSIDDAKDKIYIAWGAYSRYITYLNNLSIDLE